ncbi:MAG: acyltransferase [Pseudomonadota bacterium]
MSDRGVSTVAPLQVLRGLAATMVAGFHLYEVRQDQDGLFVVFQNGDAGVDLFFVLSGFIILYSENAAQKSSVMEFAKKRFWRLFPPYWIILTLYVISYTALIVLIGDGDKEMTFSNLAVSYLLLPYPDHIIVIAWTLSVELIFYTVFAVTFLGLGRMWFYAAMVAWVTAAQLYLLDRDLSSPFLNLVLHSSSFSFLVGAFIADLYLRGARRFRNAALWVGGISLLTYMAGLWQPPEAIGREIVPGLPAALLIYGVLDRDWRVPQVLVTWGEASYILYLLHLLFFAISGKVVSLIFGVDIYQNSLGMLAMLGAVSAVAYVACVKLERPYQKWYRKNRL